MARNKRVLRGNQDAGQYESFEQILMFGRFSDAARTIRLLNDKLPDLLKPHRSEEDCVVGILASRGLGKCVFR
jgi:hypothetical protein